MFPEICPTNTSFRVRRVFNEYGPRENTNFVHDNRSNLDEDKTYTYESDLDELYCIIEISRQPPLDHASNLV